jgi:hypothetical protein
MIKGYWRTLAETGGGAVDALSRRKQGFESARER